MFLILWGLCGAAPYTPAQLHCFIHFFSVLYEAEHFLWRTRPLDLYQTAMGSAFHLLGEQLH